ncbi:hypothetical protein [Roseiflexus castenholzii]|uniref:hypothetical protein n=1 Tax=Roseiflexus castenholzii TaxID=120962 RepID=UPI003C7CFB49
MQCIASEWPVRFHTGYLLDEQDYHDVKLLCEHFGFVMPVEYAILQNRIDSTLKPHRTFCCASWRNPPGHS